MKLKKTLEPAQLICTIDNREQTPVDVSPLKSERGTLPTGDYSIKGLEHVIALERKGLQDLIMCVGRERERFEREIQRLLAYPVRAIVVESTWAAIEMKTYRGEIEPNAVIGSLLGWMARGIPIIMAGDHERCGRFISRMLFTAARRRWEESYQFCQGIVEPPPVAINVKKN